MGTEFCIVDVFAEQKYTGNQLAVITEGESLDTETMQAIAAEMAYSETTFITGPPEQGVWPVRIFTPTDEIPFAGHPTLGTAWIIREELADGTPEQVTLGLGVGDIPVDVRSQDGTDRFWMRQREPTFGTTVPHEQAAKVLGIDPASVDSDWPVQVVSTGLPTVIVSLTDRDALTGIDLNREAYSELVEATDAKLVLAFCANPRNAENDIAARMFAPALGVFEDPATGSANGCLGAYLARHEYFGSPSVTARVEQGYELGRSSLLFLDATASVEVGGTAKDDAVTVAVGGEVQRVARGTLE